MPAKDYRYFADQAEKLILSGGEYSKGREAQVRSLMARAKAAAAVDDGGGKPTSKRSLNIEYASGEERDGWISYLRTGLGYQSRDMTSSGSGIGGTSPLVPLAFYNRVVHALKLTDQLWDPAVSTVITTPTGSPLAIPTDFDTAAAATVIGENQQGTTQDPFMGGVFLGEAPTWRTSIFGSREFLQDMGVPLDIFLSALVATRYSRGFGASLDLIGGGGPDDDGWRGGFGPVGNFYCNRLRRSDCLDAIARRRVSSAGLLGDAAQDVSLNLGTAR